MHSFALIFCTVFAVLVGISDASADVMPPNDDNAQDVVLPDFCEEVNPPACPRILRRVCDLTTNQQYTNLCIMCGELKNSHDQSFVNAVQYQEGPCPVDLPDYCDEVNPPQCPRIFRPVCDLKPNKQYPNLCVLCGAMKNDPSMIKDVNYHSQRCPTARRAGDVCDIIDSDEQSEAVMCPAVMELQCASNGITYNNKCEMCKAVQLGNLAAEATFTSGQCE